MNLKQLLLFAFLILAGFWVRLYKIDNPIADWHSWRQADTAMVTRNFIKFGIDPFIPRYDDLDDPNGSGVLNPNGYRMVEFPVFNLLHLVTTKLLPAETLEYSGRMTAILISLSAGVALFFLVRRHSRTSTAFLALAGFLFLPYNIYFSRVILPDMLMVALSLVTMNLFDLWIKKTFSILLLLTAICGALALLVKPMAVFIMLPMLWSARARLKDYRLYLMGILTLLPFLVWRVWVARFPEGTPAFWWLLNGNNIRLRPAFFRWIFGERIGSMILGKWGSVILISGIIALTASPYLLIFFASSILYLVVFATGNIQHDYYQMVIIPAFSVALALGVSYLFKPETKLFATLTKRGLLVACIAMAVGFSWYEVKGNYQVNHWEIVQAGTAVKRLTQPDAVVVADYNGDSAFLYNTDRRGFTLLASEIENLTVKYGVSYYISTSYGDQTNGIMKKYQVVEETPKYVVVRLQ